MLVEALAARAGRVRVGRRLRRGSMTLNPNTIEQERIAAAAERRRQRVARRERTIESVSAVGLLAVTAGLWLLAGASPGDIDTLPALACILCLAVAVHVQFAVGDGYTVPTQLAFVPLLFTLPPALVPIAVMIALTGARLPAVITGRWPTSRMLLAINDAWFAVGPAVVLAAAHAPSVHGLSVTVIVAMLAAQILVEIASWAARERLLGRVRLRDQLGELWVHGVDLALTPVALVVALVVEQHPWAALALLPLLGVLAIFSRERQHRLASLTELNQAYRGTALVLGDVVEADDGYTGEHSRGVLSLCLQVGRLLGLDAARLRNLEFAALLHDVGKIAIPKEIINKPGRLDPAEWTIIKTHTLEGQRLLDRVGGFMREVGLIVRSHHERWDGSGYPDGLLGEQIPLEARIVACCDAWNAMTTARSYRAALPAAAALAEVRHNRGTQFDPAVVDALLRCVARDADTDPRDEGAHTIAA
jgi:HD-GYP domain-containing protein (c-di-GMP phosphodiesterase class II)